jgi:two-component system sensor histidine kinase PilS (NtrC family)
MKAATLLPRMLPKLGPNSRTGPGEQRQGLYWLIRMRLFLITFLLFVQLGIWYFRSSPFDLNVKFFVFTISLWYTLTLLFAILLRVWPDYTTQSYIQVLCDASILTAIVYLTGGVESYFIFLFPLIVVAAGVSLPRPGPYLVASLSFILLGSVLELAWYGKIQPTWPIKVDSEGQQDPRELQRMQLSILTNLFAFMTVAYLSSTLADSLRRTGSQLSQTSGALDNLQAFNQNVLDSIAAGVLTIDMAGRVQLLNHAGETILGQPLSSLSSRRLEEALPEIAAVGATPPGGEVRLKTPAGVERTLGVTISPLASTDGGPVGSVYVIQDLTDFKRLERDLRLQDRMAALGRMASAIAHEIRNPLSAIAGSVKVFSITSDLSEDEQRLVDIVRKESERLDRTLAEFLSFSRERKYEFLSFDLVALLEDTVTLIRHRPGTDRWRITADLPPRPLLVPADVDAIKQVFWNLCDNALKAMPDGGTLTLRAALQGGNAVIEFRDTGPGIAPGQLEKIFEPYQTGFSSGSGLGLAIVYEIVAAHQGKITAETVPGESGKASGTLFRLILPVAVLPAVEHATGRSTARAPHFPIEK